MAMGTVDGPARRDAGAADVRAVARGLRRHPALRRQLDGRQPVALGPPVGEHADGGGLRRLRPGLRRRRRRRLRGQLQRRAVPALDAVRRADAVLPQPLRDRQRRPVRVGVGRRRARRTCARRSSCATGCCRTSTRRSCGAAETGEPVQRPLVFDHQDDPAVRDIDDEYLLGPRPAGRAGDRSRARPRARSTCPRASWYDWHTGRAGRRRPLRRGADADGADPALRARRCGHPDVAGGAAVDGRLPPGRRSSCTCSCPARDGDVRRRCCRRTTGSRSRRSRARATRTTFTRDRAGDDGDACAADVDGDGYPEFAREAFELVLHGVDGDNLHLPNEGTGFTVEVDLPDVTQSATASSDG